MKDIDVTFKNLGLGDALLKTLADEGYDTPTPIQNKAIPPILKGHDVVGLAQTGTGKTAAFTLPLLHRMMGEIPAKSPRDVRMLVLSPTRELAAQIETAVKTYGRGLGLWSASVVGGVPVRRHRLALKNGIDILVATPGRLEDLVAQKIIRLDRVQSVVLDEADQMLDIGFLPAIKRILKLLPKKRQTLLFSATMPKEIKALSNDYLSEAVEVSVTPAATTVEKINQSVMHMQPGDKPSAVAKLIKANPGKRVIIFTRTKRGADKVTRKLNSENLSAEAIHGNKSQNQRTRTLAAFRDGSKPVLTATDIAARGIDVPGVELIVNYDLPHVPESYVHRIGRTARAGASGLAVSFCTADDVKLLRAIERLIRLKIPALMVDGTAIPESAPEVLETPRPPKHRPRRRFNRDGDSGDSMAMKPKKSRRRRPRRKPASAA